MTRTSELAAPGWVRRWFAGAAIYGGVILSISLVSLAGKSQSPPLAQVAFLGVAGAFQLVFWQIARDPIRLRPIMPACVGEKLVFGALAFALARHEPDPKIVLCLAALDLALGAGFIIAWRLTPRSLPTGDIKCL